MSVLRKIPWLLAAVLLLAGCVQDSTTEYLVGPQGDLIIQEMIADPVLKRFQAEERELKLLLARSTVHTDSAFVADEYVGFDFTRDDAVERLRSGGFLRPERMVELELRHQQYYRYLLTQYLVRVNDLPAEERQSTLDYIEELARKNPLKISDDEYHNAVLGEVKKKYDVKL